jgi:hypothetical protein
MLELGVIKPSFATNYSHVHLAPKLGGKLHFCIDYRLLIVMTHSRGDMIPPIFGVLQRIGNHDPKIFGTMDLTSGYHQTAYIPRIHCIYNAKGLIRIHQSPVWCTELLLRARA